MKLKAIPLIILAVPLYLLMLIFGTFMVLLGWILIPPQALFYRYTTYTRASTLIKDRIIRDWKFKFMYPWGNEEEGIAAGLSYHDFKSIPLQIIYWAANRNPTNNLRFVPFISLLINPAKVRWIGNREGEDIHVYDMGQERFWYFCWCGAYSNFRVQFKMGKKLWRFWVGWKIYPHDSLGLKPDDYRIKGASFATQFKRIASDENMEYR